jgi:hypothetical protein
LYGSDPELTITQHQSSSGFVDDITHWNIHIRNSLIRPETTDELYQSTQTTAQWWENLLYSSGGTLELRKCFYYMFHWQFASNGVPSFSPTTAFPIPIQVKHSITETFTPIKHKPCCASHKTLGKMENPLGNYDNKAHRIKSKVDTFAQHIRTAAMTEAVAGTLYCKKLLPSLFYGIASACMTLK